jgi:hypothetical protein
MESVGALPVGDEVRQRMAALSGDAARAEGWRLAREAGRCARQAGFAGVVLMGLRFETVVGEAYEAWHADD